MAATTAKPTRGSKRCFTDLTGSVPIYDWNATRQAGFAPEAEFWREKVRACFQVLLSEAARGKGARELRPFPQIRSGEGWCDLRGDRVRGKREAEGRAWEELFSS